MNDSIRVERKDKRVEVNDQGDYIILPFGDQAFVPALLNMMNDFEAHVEQHRKRVEELASLPDDNAEKVADMVQINLDVCSVLAAGVDRLFGDGSCVKIFGVNVPSLFAFADFFDQLAPIIRAFSDKEAAARVKRVRKYSEKYQKREV